MTGLIHSLGTHENLTSTKYVWALTITKFQCYTLNKMMHSNIHDAYLSRAATNGHNVQVLPSTQCVQYHNVSVTTRHMNCYSELSQHGRISICRQLFIGNQIRICIIVLITDLCLELWLAALVTVAHWAGEQCEGCSQHLLECRTSTNFNLN